VISKYVHSDQADEIRFGIEKRKHTESMLLSLKKEKKLADKILGGAV
jgi:septum formation topological specificity factor MinE